MGGVGSGKSTVARLLCEQFPAAVIDADAAGHQTLTEEPIQQLLRGQFSDEIFDADGNVIRRKLGGIVFGTDKESSCAKQELEKIVHPRIGELIREQINTALQDQSLKAVILDAAVLLETGWKEFCDAVVFVNVPVDVRRQRVLTDRHWTAEEFAFREANQLAVETKRELSDYVIDNSGSSESAAQQLLEIIQQLPCSQGQVKIDGE